MSKKIVNADRLQPAITLFPTKHCYVAARLLVNYKGFPAGTEIDSLHIVRHRFNEGVGCSGETFNRNILYTYLYAFCENRLAFDRLFAVDASLHHLLDDVFS